MSTRTETMGDELVRISRELDPETWAKVDRIARIVDPGAFTDAVDAEGRRFDERTDILGTRLRYMQAVAVSRAWDILRALGIVPAETDWLPIFERLQRRLPEAARPADPEPRS